MTVIEIQNQIESLASPMRRDAAYGLLTGLVSTNETALRLVLEAIGTHPAPPVRRACADLMDHHGDDRCVPALLEALHDPIPNVRRQAAHSLGCQRCKSCALTLDTVPHLIEVALQDDNMWVRREAVFALSMLPPDTRVAEPLRTLQVRETHPKIVGMIHDALKHHDSEYRRAAIAESKARQPFPIGEVG